MESLISYLGCGKIITQSKSEMIYLTVTKSSDIFEKIIPFFNKYPILGVKHEDFLDFCKGGEILKAKGHLKEEGFKEIKRLRDLMNKGRS